MEKTTKLEIDPVQLNSALIVFQMVRNKIFLAVENNNDDLALLASCLRFVKNPLTQKARGLEVLD